MLQGHVLPTAALLLLVVKAIIWSVALGSGTSGGVLAPLLIMGGAMGAALAGLHAGGSPGFWALLGMAATMGGTMRSPLTATFFAVELTGNTHVLLPLIAACGDRARGDRAADAPLDPDRKGRAARPSSRARIPGRSVCPDPGARGDDDRGRDRAGDDDPAWRRRLPDRPGHHPSELSGGRYASNRSSASSIRRRCCAGAGPACAAPARLANCWPGPKSRSPTRTNISKALADRLTAANVAHLPVVSREDGRLVGYIGWKDLMRVRAKLQAEERQRTSFFRIRPASAD